MGVILRDDIGQCPLERDPGKTFPKGSLGAWRVSPEHHDTVYEWKKRRRGLAACGHGSGRWSFHFFRCGAGRYGHEDQITPSRTLGEGLFRVALEKPGTDIVTEGHA